MNYNVWQREFAQKVAKFTNEELLNEVLDSQERSSFSNRSIWERRFLEMELRKRLHDWLNSDVRG